MNTNVMDEILKNAPSEMRTLIGGLVTDETWAIYVYLYGARGTKTLRSDMRDYFELTDKELTRHLKPLIQCGLVDQRAESVQELFNYEKAVYCVTNMGKNLLPRLWDVIMPPEMREAAKRLKENDKT